MTLYGLQYLNVDSDYPDDWYDFDAWGDEPIHAERGPIRFPSEQDAQAFLDAMLEASQTRRMALWQAAHDAWVPKRELYLRRLAALEAAGLGKQDGESWMPLDAPGGPGKQPVEGRENWRVVADADMYEPAVEHETPPQIVRACDRVTNR